MLAKLPKPGPFPTREVYPISFNQGAYWFLNHLNPQLWHLSFSRHLKGPLDIDLFKKALQLIVNRHASLRTCFKKINGEPYQFVFKSVPIEVAELDFSHLPGARQTAEIQRLAIMEESESIIPLEFAPLMKAKLVKCKKQEYIFFLTLPHIISDELSARIIWRDVSHAYSAFISGEKPHFETSPIQYHDYVLWEKELVDTEYFQSLREYWEQQFSGDWQILELPVDHALPGKRSYLAKRVCLNPDAEQTKKMRTLSFRNKTTVSCFLMAAFNILLYRYTGQDDIVIGFPFAGRRYSTSFLETVGPFAGVSPFRTRLSGNPTFIRLLERVRETLYDVYEHQVYPIELIMKHIKPIRKEDGSFPFRVMFNKLPLESPEPAMKGLSVRPGPAGLGKMHFDLCLYVLESRDSLKIELTYNSDIFEEQTIVRMVSHFHTLLKNILLNPGQKIDHLEILTPLEYRRQIHRWNETRTLFPENASVHEMFEAQANKTPDSTALIHNDRHLTYHVLNRRADRLSHLYLLQEGNMEPGKLIGLSCGGALEMVTGILAILKAGGTYVPLDASVPEDRLRFILEDTGVSMILTQSKLVNSFRGTTASIRCLDSEPGKNSRPMSQRRKKRAGPRDPAYVIFTSGSTGRPKGIVMTHGALLNLLLWNFQTSKAAAGGRTLQFASHGFDVSLQEIFLTLCFGGTLVLLPGELRSDPPGLIRFITSRAINRLFLPFAFLQQLAETGEYTDRQPTALREIISAGEQLQITRSVRNWFGRPGNCSLINQYGPTETHVVSSFELEGAAGNWSTFPPIGRPIANVQIYLLDTGLNPVPIGVPGELYIAGKCLARGYLNRPDLTAERFILNPFHGKPGARLYRTGDLARYLPDGNIEFLGRTDRQVKIRGFRIEPAEIETLLLEHPAVSEAVVTARLYAGNKRLVAYIIPKPGGKPGELEIPAFNPRHFLKEKLPRYMVPSEFVYLESLPLTPSGKPDRRLLPEPDFRKNVNRNHAAPRNSIERKITKIWEAVLNKKPISITDDFFELGGDSLLGIKLLSMIFTIFQVKINVPALIKYPTIPGLAEQVRSKIRERPNRSGTKKDISPLLIPIRPMGDKKPFFLVPGGDGGKTEIFVYAQFAPHLCPERPYYQFLARGLDGINTPIGKVKDIAKEYIGAIRSVQPGGPYLIGGECMGGIIAFEMARQLEKQGQRPALLLLIDTWCPGRRFGFAKTGSYKFLENQLNSSLIRFRESLEEMAPNKRIRYAGQIYKRSVLRYKPGKYRGKITLLVSEESFQKDPAMGWRGLADMGLEIRKVPGDHMTYIRQYHPIVGKEMKYCIENADKA